MNRASSDALYLCPQELSVIFPLIAHITAAKC